MTSDLNARVAVVTGASSGIGKAAAIALAAQGWRIIGVGRNPDRCASAEAELRAASTTGEVLMVRADLSVLSEATAAARTIAMHADRIDVLLNNAGGVRAERMVTSDGNEATFAGNHLGPFVLTERLLPLLRAAAVTAPAGSVRIINVSSSGHEHSRGLDWHDLQSLDNFVSGAAYCNAKLANLLFTRSLVKRLSGDGIIVHAMHPGIVGSNFISHADDGMQRYFKTQADVMLTAEEGADTLIWLATADEAGRTSGGYFHKRKPVPMHALAQDDASAERLWRESDLLVQRAKV